MWEGTWKPVSGSLFCPAQAFAGRHMQPKSGAASKDNLLVSRAAFPRQISGAACGGSHHWAALPALPALGPILPSAVVRGFVLRENRCRTVVYRGRFPEIFSRAAPIGQPPFNSSASAYLGQLVVWGGVLTGSSGAGARKIMFEPMVRSGGLGA